jgi:hypothetical protein
VIAIERDAAVLLDAWERGMACSPDERAEALLATWRAAEQVTETVGERNARLLTLHVELFGSRLDLLSHCPQCGMVAQFPGDCEQLRAHMHQRGGEGPHTLYADGCCITFRLPQRRDVIALSEVADADAFAHRLLERCVVKATLDGQPLPARDIPVAVRDALSARMDALDPGAAISFALECPQCAARWDAPLDVGQLVWQRVQSAAEHLLLDIDALARAYGWTESEVLRLAPMRRAAYLQMVTT